MRPDILSTMLVNHVAFCGKSLHGAGTMICCLPGIKSSRLATWLRMPFVATWFTNIVDRMSGLNNNYTLPLTTSLAAQHGTRYAGLSNDLSEDPTFPRDITHNLPFPHDMLGRARILILIDSTMLPKATKNWLLMDVLVFTMPFATMQQMAQLALAIYQKPPITSTS